MFQVSRQQCTSVSMVYIFHDYRINILFQLIKQILFYTPHTTDEAPRTVEDIVTRQYTLRPSWSSLTLQLIAETTKLRAPANLMMWTTIEI